MESTLAAWPRVTMHVTPSRREALSLIGQSEFDVLLLDIELSDGSGWDLVRALDESLPVFVVSAETAAAPRISARCGSSRNPSVLRRAHGFNDGSCVELGDLRPDTESRTVSLFERPVELTAREFDLLAFLARNPGRVFSRAQLLAHVWQSSREWQDEGDRLRHRRQHREATEDNRRSPIFASSGGRGDSPRPPL